MPCGLVRDGSTRREEQGHQTDLPWIHYLRLAVGILGPRVRRSARRQIIPVDAHDCCRSLGYFRFAFSRSIRAKAL